MRFSAKGSGRLPLVRIGSFAGALLLVGGVAIATGAIPDSNDGEVHFCYGVQEGDARIIDHQAGRRCKSFEREVVLNQEGPTGPTGPSGTSQGYSIKPGGFLLNSNEMTTVIQKTVPAGRYMVSGTLGIQNDDATGLEFVLCELVSSSAGFVADNLAIPIAGFNEPGGTESLAMQGSSIHPSSPSTIALRCRMGNVGQDAWMRDPTLNIVELDAIDTTPDPL